MQPATSKREVAKVAIYSVLILGLGVLATACSKAPTSPTTSGGVQIRIWRTGQAEDAIKSNIAQFKAKNKSANLTITYDNRDIETYEVDALKSLGARTGPDIWSIPNDWLGDHVPRIQPIPANYFFPLDSKGKRQTTGPSPAEQVKELFPEGISEQLIGTDGESVLGLPTNVDSLRLYYNRELFSAAATEFQKSLGSGAKSEDFTPVKTLFSKAPATWGDVLEMEKYLTKLDGNTVVRSAIALGTADNVSKSADIVSLLILQNGAKVVSVDRKNALFHIPTTSPSGVVVSPGELALDFFTSFSNPAKASYTWNPSMPQDLDAFGQGRVAMVIAFTDFEAQLKIKYPRFRFDTAAVPQNSVTQAPVNLIKFNIETVTKTADNTAAAFAFLPYYADQSHAVNLASQANLTSPYTIDLDRKKTDPLVSQIITGKSIFKRSREQFDQSFRQMIIDVSQNGLTNAKALDSAADRINVLLQADNQL
ncbi:hypothetical protein BH11PAT4_BH11PAT4_1870 [soil metagenome]